MPRNISFLLTTKQFLDGTKDVTRRMGWRHLKAGDVLCAVEKSQGLGKGGKIKRLGMIRVVDARQERLDALLRDVDYGLTECRREGFPTFTAAEFIAFFCKSHEECTPSSLVTRIEFQRLPADA